MNVARYLAWRFARGQRRALSRLSVVLAIGSIGIGVAVMEVSLAIVEGFDHALTAKIVGFVSDAELVAYRPQDETTLTTLRRDPGMEDLVRALPFVQSIDAVLHQEALLQGRDGHEGVRLKGVAPDWSGAFFGQALVAGRLPRFSATDTAPNREVLISSTLARLLRIELGSSSTVVFYREGQARFRKLKVVGLYETGLAEFDKVVAVVDMRLLQQLLGLQPDDVQSFEVRYLADAGLPATAMDAALNNAVPHTIRTVPVRERTPELFDWIGLQHQNVQFILALMALVAVVNLTTAVLILITERTRTIGLLKALGATGNRLMGVFLWQAAFIVGAGLLLGNTLGLGLLALQQSTGVLELDPENYFVRTLPVAWPWRQIVVVNVGLAVVCVLAMVVPARRAARIQPVVAFRFR
jgi:lipoprotein-releasing system permease protein